MNDRVLLSGLKKGDVNVFSFLCTAYYKDMVIFGRSYLSEPEICEDIVQSVFMKLWNDRETIEIETSFKSYLLVSVRNRCVDEIRRRDIIREYQLYVLPGRMNEELKTENDILHADLCDHLEKALHKLPRINREAFVLNRFQGLKYREIARRLNISERKVETCIEKALTSLRKRLKEFR
jgi:RNA polymerase sigma-70 factor (ECF subfamily)